VRELQEAGFEAFIVGGSVRDLLLGKIPKDFDVATSATPEEVQDVFPRCRLIGRRFRLAHVRKAGALIEVATFRGSAATGGDHEDSNGRILRDNVFGSVEEDAIRRDFTINALFLDPVSGDIRDYVGGYEDLANRRLRLIGDPEVRYREDPVRLLRAARFEAKLGVDPDEEAVAPIRAMAPLLKDVPPARLFEEICKLFLTGHGVRSMESLQRFGLSASLFPGLRKGSGPGKVQLGSILLKALENTDERVRTSKPVTPAFLFAALLCGRRHRGPGPEHRHPPQVQRGDPADLGDAGSLQTNQGEAVETPAPRTAFPGGIRFSAVAGNQGSFAGTAL
jgi:poly(A) polymerase